MNAPARGLQLAASIVSAAIIAAGVLLFDWPPFTVLAFYWLENVAIGGFTAVRILALGARSERYVAALATPCSSSCTTACSASCTVRCWRRCSAASKAAASTPPIRCC